METTNKLGKGEMGYKCLRIILPHCVKRFLDDIDFEAKGEVEKFTKKVEAEGYMCFQVIK